MHAETLRVVGRSNYRLQDIQLSVDSQGLKSSLFDEIVWDDSTFAPSALRWTSRNGLSAEARKRAKEGPQAASLPVVIGSGSHPFPFRTRKLSLIPPMVLHGKLCGRVGRCRHYFEKPDWKNQSGFCFVPPTAHR